MASFYNTTTSLQWVVEINLGEPQHAPFLHPQSLGWGSPSKTTMVMCKLLALRPQEVTRLSSVLVPCHWSETCTRWVERLHGGTLWSSGRTLLGGPTIQIVRVGGTTKAFVAPPPGSHCSSRRPFSSCASSRTAQARQDGRLLFPFMAVPITTQKPLSIVGRLLSASPRFPARPWRADSFAHVSSRWLFRPICAAAMIINA